MLKNGRGPLWQGLLLAGLLALTGVASASPGSFLYEQNRKMEAWLADLEEHTVTVKGVRWTYYARHLDKTGCEVLVHGFTAEAANWFRFARHLDKDSCLVVPDLPGFGRSAYDPAWDFAVPAQTARLHDFLQAIKAQGPYHLVGSSMGGHIALTYTLKYPGEVASLALVDAGGVQSPTPSDHAKQLKASGRTAFDIRSREDFPPFLAMGMHEQPWLPGIVRDHLADEFIARNARYMSIFKAIFGKDLLDERLREVTTPTLVLWGERDRLLHVSMADVFRRGISGSRTEVMKDIGHLPFLEAPAESAEIYRRFRGLPSR
ncbi:MAG: hypothetical protein K0Q68_23 [Moraxellaceae bacterium]|jgi:pimeloyl-ACP methyl ester carboxylesterase|nr:hypothetical protein [Moraxellaceae bacterium]